jgi:hypothetical protein
MEKAQKTQPPEAGKTAGRGDGIEYFSVDWWWKSLDQSIYSEPLFKQGFVLLINGY